jgi:hypothetical protein
MLAPLVAALSLSSACVGSDAPAVDTKVDSSVPPVASGPPGDAGTDAPVADAAPKTCRPGDPFGEPVVVIENLGGATDFRGARRIPGFGLVYAEITDPYTSRLRVRLENSLATEDSIISDPSGMSINGADVRIKNGVTQIVFTAGTYPIGARAKRPERILYLGTLVPAGKDFEVKDPQMLNVAVLDPADPVFADTGIYISYLKNNSVAGNPDFRTIKFFPNVGVDGGVIQTAFDLFKDQIGRTSPLFISGAPLYFSALNADLEATQVVAYSPDNDPKEVPSTIAKTPKWPVGATWISPDQCEVYLSLPSSRIPDHTGIYSAKRTPR